MATSWVKQGNTWVQVSNQNDGAWEVPKAERTVVYHSCPFVGQTVYLLPQAMRQVVSLMQLMLKTEWLAYLVGHLEPNGSPVVERLVVPAQKVSVGSVDVNPNQTIPDQCIGVIHSHHTLGAAFSGTDDQYINANHPLSILVTVDTTPTNPFKVRFISEHRKQVACGQWIVATPAVELWTEMVRADTDFLAEAAACITVQKTAVRGVGDKAVYTPYEERGEDWLAQYLGELGDGLEY